MASVSNWMYVDLFTVDQAAALWCDHDPSKMSIVDTSKPSEVVAAKQMLISAIVTGLLFADSRTNPLASIGEYSKSFVHRTELELLAKSRGLFPAFLFDTLAPIEDVARSSFDRLQTPVQVPPLQTEKPDANRGGRPVQYDWDSFTMEIISKANHPDGLPDTQAELLRKMLDWFSTTYGSEPAESSVKSRISKIYNYLRKAENLVE